MKRVFFLLIPLFINCSRSTPTQDSGKRPKILDASATRVSTYQKPKVFFVVRKDVRAPLFTDAEESSTRITEVGYGARLVVVGEQGEWYKVDCRKESGTEFFIPGYSTSFIKKNFLVQDSKINLTYAQLNEANKNFQALAVCSAGIGSVCNPFIELSFVSKEYFYNMKEFSETDKSKPSITAVRTKNSLKLKWNNQTKEFYDENDYTFSFKGLHPELNGFLVCKEYTGDFGEDPSEDLVEDVTYILIDKQNGNELDTFYSSYPHVSPDKRLVMQVWHHIFQDEYSLQLRTVSGDKFFSSSMYENWIIADRKLMFWGKDNCFYFSILPRFLSYRVNGKRIYAGDTSKYRYVKVHLPPLSTFAVQQKIQGTLDSTTVDITE